MNDRERRLTKILIVSWFLALLLLIGIAVYFSVSISKVDAKAAAYGPRISSNEISIDKLTGSVEKINEALKKVSEQSKVPGPKGDTGDKGDAAVSNNTVIEKQTTVTKEVPIKGDQGDKGEDARQIALCKIPFTSEIGWMYVGTNSCIALEIVQ